MAGLPMNSHIVSGGVALLREVRGLRSVADDMIGKQFSESETEVNEPILSGAVSSVHGCAVLPVDIHSVEIVFLNELAQLIGTVQSAELLSGWKLFLPESTDHYFYSVLVVDFLEVTSDFIVGVSEACSKVLDRV